MSGGGVLRWAEYRAVPWRNGGGTTREVASGRVREAGGEEFDWRVSVADVDAGGPFSAFPGVDRVITLVEGSGMVLTVDGEAPRLVEPLVPFAFPGDARTDCRLDAGAVRDMNVMTRRGRASGHVRMVRVDEGGTELTGAAGEILLALAVTEGVALEGPDTPLGRLDSVRATPGQSLALRGTGTVAEIRITPER
ncbi:HutD/Ves family protein [Streptomyces sp. P6-2-1]|uniref:HutD/Ves family protein n=1 Tax=unclassified Streptomyces TaxID=2593676 RepID=UPI003D35CCCD